MGFRMAGFGGNGWKENSCSAGHSGRRTAKGSRENSDKFVVIDVDSDGFNSVVVIDAPESVGTELRGYSVLGKGRGFHFPGIISIDDDDDEEEDDQHDESDNAEHPPGDVKYNPEGNTEGRSGGDSPASNDMQNYANSGHDDGRRVFEGEGPAFNISRCTKSKGTRGFSRNRFGLDFELEDDSSDCEILEGSSEELRQQWERASSRRKSCRRQSVGRDQASPCSSNSHSDADFGVGINDKKNMEAPESSNLENLNNEEFGSFAFKCTGDGLAGGRGSPNHNIVDGFSESDQKCNDRVCSWGLRPKSREKTVIYENDNSYFTVETSMEDYAFFAEECPQASNFSACFPNKRKAFHGSSACFNQDMGDKDNGHLRTGVHEDVEQDTCARNAFSKSKSEPRRSTDDDETLVRNEGSVTEDQYWCEKGHVVPDSCDEKDGDITDKDTTKNDGDQKHKLGTELSMSSLSGGNETLRKSGDETELWNVRDQSCTSPGDRTYSFSRDIINEREKLKETDEYKRAVEQEWLARQQQLQIQAEEAQRLRKRRKAESSRALDMEKRQKQRLEEIRETQKKDEEHLNLKEKLRGEVRKELHLLEMACFDMASLLRGLGIPVGFHPLSSEVHAAYKRALLKFHPDRVSRSDIRQQVEAEEKFKLICRMKEKFLSPS